MSDQNLSGRRVWCWSENAAGCSSFCKPPRISPLPREVAETLQLLFLRKQLVDLCVDLLQFLSLSLYVLVSRFTGANLSLDP